MGEIKEFYKNKIFNYLDKKDENSVFRTIFISKNYIISQDEKMLSPILKIVPIENNKYIVEKFKEDLSGFDILKIKKIDYWKDVIKKVTFDIYDSKKDIFYIKIDFPVRFYYKNKFVKLLYPCVIFAGIINYFTKYISDPIFSSEEIKRMVSESRQHTKPIFMMGEVFKFNNKEYIKGEFKFFVNRDWKYFYIAKFIESISYFLVTM